MRIVVCLVVALLCAAPASADGIADSIREFRLMGTWATDCGKEVTTTQRGFRIVFAASPGGAPTHRAIDSDGETKTTVDSMIVSAVRTGPRQLKLRLRIFGGDRNGSLLPSPTTNTFDELIEMVGADRIRLVGTVPQLLERCRD